MPDSTNNFLLQAELFIAKIDRRERRRRCRNEIETRRRWQEEQRRRQREQERRAAREREKQEEQRRRRYFVFEASVPKVIKVAALATPVSLLTVESP